MMLQIKNNQKLFDVNYLKTIIRHALQISIDCTNLSSKEVKQIFSVLLTGDKEIKKLNNEFRSIDKETDVLSFPGIESNGKVIKTIPKQDIYLNDKGEKEVQMGDMVLSIESIVQQADDLGHSFEKELTFLTIHSFLHLIGYDHIDEYDEKKMIKKQKQIIAKAGFAQEEEI